LKAESDTNPDYKNQHREKEPLDHSVWVPAGVHVSYLIWLAAREINSGADEIVSHIGMSRAQLVKSPLVKNSQLYVIHGLDSSGPGFASKKGPLAEVMTGHMIINGPLVSFLVHPKHLQVTRKDYVEGISSVSLPDHNRPFGVALDLHQGCQVFQFILRQFFKQGTSP